MRKKTTDQTKKQRLSRGRIVLLAIALCVFIGCVGWYIVYTFVLPARETRELSRIADAKNAAESDTSAAAPAEPQQVYDIVLPQYESLLAENPDLRGWITVPEYGIDLPIVQGPDNDYYLRRSFTGEWSLAGTPFFDCRVADFVNLPRNTVVYGHNMRRNDIMFGVFQNLRTVEGYRNCPVIGVSTVFRDYRWFVYAVFITNIDPAQDNGFFFAYNHVDISDAAFEGYLREIDRRKLYTTGVEISPDDKLLTISTCCYDFRNARLVVVARMQRENEADRPDTSLAAENPSPKYPQVWYDARGTANPYRNDLPWYPETPSTP